MATIQSRDQGKVLYASGSEEKVVRILEAPQAYIETLAYLRGESATPPSQVCASSAFLTRAACVRRTHLCSPDKAAARRSVWPIVCVWD